MSGIEILRKTEGSAQVFQPAQASDWTIPFGFPIIGSEELDAVTATLRSGRLATGLTVREFEDAFSEQFKVPHASAVSSGSMANLLALAAAIEAKKISRGDRVIVSGATFHTAIAPVIQLGLVPVFVDLLENDVNVDLNAVGEAINIYGARAALLPHALGQPLDRHKLQLLIDDFDLFLIEDCCESLGAGSETSPVGLVGEVATYSFYAGHHLTTGEGGMVCTSDEGLDSLIKSVRSFGRDTGWNGKRFDYPVGARRIAPDERYIHIRLGFNGKMTDLQAAIGLKQLERARSLFSDRKALARRLVAIVRGVDSVNVLGSPAAVDACPFALALLFPSVADATRRIGKLLENGIEVRGLLGATCSDQPCFDSADTILHSNLSVTKNIAQRTIVIGCPPGLDHERAASALRQALGN